MKRVISLLLAVSLLLTLNLTVFAETPEYQPDVEDNDFGGTVEFVALSGLPEAIEPGAASIPTITAEDGEVKVGTISWTDEYGVACTSFEAGKGYYLNIPLKTNITYTFAEEVWVLEDTTGREACFVRTDSKNLTASFYYSLKEQIDFVSLTITGTELGDNVDNVTVSAPAEATYTFGLSGVYHYESCDYVTNVTFQDKNSYSVEVSLMPLDGYDFATEVTVEINGEYDIYYPAPDGFVYEQYISFLEKIEIVKLTLPEPEIGGNVADFVVTAPENANYTVVTGWYDTVAGEYMESGTFADGGSYELMYDVYANDGFDFSDELEVYLNGEYHEDFNGNSNNIWGYKTYSFLEKINSVAFPAFPTANPGDSVDVSLETPAGVNYTLLGAWLEMETLEAATSLEEGKDYLLAYMAQPNDGYEFADDVKITVGGKAFTGLVESSEFFVIAAKAYNFGAETISSVDLTVPLPELGASVGEVTLPENVHYSADEWQWEGDDDKDYHNGTYAAEVFEAGQYYYVSMILSADEGYAFTDDTKVTVNGEEADVAYVMNLGSMYLVVVSMGRMGQVTGDMNGDNVIDTDDVIQLLLHVSMPDLFSIDAPGDINGDGEVNTDDAVQLLLHISMPDMFPL